MNKIIVGKIINTHGIKGEVKLLKDHDRKLNQKAKYYIEGNCEQYTIKSERSKGNISIIKFLGYDNINDVVGFKGCNLAICEKDLLELDVDEYYIKDLIGLDIYDENSQYVGELVDVLSYAANDVYVVQTHDGDKMIPAVKEFIKKVDIKNKKIVIKFIEGMWDENRCFDPIS